MKSFKLHKENLPLAFGAILSGVYAWQHGSLTQAAIATAITAVFAVLGWTDPPADGGGDVAA